TEHHLRIGSAQEPAAALRFEVPGLDPRLRATVVRTDGVELTLCGEREGPSDPAAEILRSLRESSATDSAAEDGR
ncbi:MAG: hypothetical protein AAF488_15310, partial [Planctomycetota bacterium]